MRCQNPDCLKTMATPSEKTKETGKCGKCRREIEKNQPKPKLKLKLTIEEREKAKKRELTAIKKFEDSLKDNPKYREFLKMFRD